MSRRIPKGTVIHNGSIQNECGKPLTQSDVVTYLTKLGVEKFEPNGFVRALKAMGK